MVEGERIERLVQKTNFQYQDSVLRFARTLRTLGVEDALRKRGAENGDTVIIGGMEFEFNDELDL